MQLIKTISIISFLTIALNLYSQDNRMGVYFQPEYSAMFLEDHVGNVVGASIGITTKNKKWDIGIRSYGRSGPINLHQEYELVLPQGTTYKGKSVLLLAADHVALGLEIAYNLQLQSERLSLRFPLSIGAFGAGFYLQNDDRITPDGRRVSEWEDELQDGEDAGIGTYSEFGAQVIYQLIPDNEYLDLFAGITYTNTYGYSSFLGGEDFFNNRLRASIGIRIEL
ncbi:MAG: hypothetical protein AAGG75_17180 [Bacteroidota bacterium]